MGLAGWAAIGVLVAVWQGIALATGSHWPTVSEMLDVVMRPLLGRAIVFALWLWLGWHLFVRGWEDFVA